ncbi:MAG: hypothetical protein KKC77_19355 [Proteobacteria bacterium]|nr:hypothetical protein [Pseudomonadota bacterium]
MEIKQLKPEEYSEDRKKVMVELNEQQKKEKVNNPYDDSTNPYLNTITHPNKIIKNKQIYIVCIKCKQPKLCTEILHKRVLNKQSDEKAVFDTYLCRSCRKV